MQQQGKFSYTGELINESEPTGAVAYVVRVQSHVVLYIQQFND